MKFDYIRLDTTNEKLDPGAICDYRFVISWDENSTDSAPGPIDFDIELDYEQDTDTIDLEPSHNHGEGEKFTAFFNANGGELSINSKEITKGNKYGDLPIPTKTEYTFLGWYTELENGTLVTSEDTVNVSDNITLHALWSWDGHSYGLYSTTQVATCTEEGEETAVCSVCGNVSTRTLSALGHDYDEGKITQEATCAVTGIKTYTCKNDSAHTLIETIPVVDHTYGTTLVYQNSS